MLKRVAGCTGMTLWASRGLRVELWVCGRTVEEHAHPGQEVGVLPLWGWGTFWQWIDERREEVWIGPARWWRRWLMIGAGLRHGFAIERGPLVFLNATFEGPSGRATSAADNFAD